MATYIPNATQTTEPVESRTVESAALEFRTLKTSITARIEDVQDGLDTEIVNRIAGDANLQTQNNAQDVRLTAIENALPFIGEGAVPGTVYVQRFSGTGVQTAFTLDVVPHAGNVVDIYVNGLYQNKDTFSVAGAVITFSEAPPAGTDNIEVQVTVTIALGETDASLVTYQQAGTGAVVRTAQDKLREWVSVKDFGAVGDGVADDTVAIQAAVNSASKIYIPDGAYKVDAVTRIKLKSNQVLFFSKNASFSVITNSSAVYGALSLINVDNVKVVGAKIFGDRVTHTGVAGENGSGIEIFGSTNVLIKDAEISDCWGDAIYVGIGITPAVESSNVTVVDSTFKNSRRNNATVAKATNVKFIRCQFTNANGVSPEAGVDVEPNAGDFVDSVLFENCTFSGNNQAGLALMEAAGSISNVRVIGGKSINNGYQGIVGGGSVCTIDNITIQGNGREGIWAQFMQNSKISGVYLSDNCKAVSGAGHIYVQNCVNMQITDSKVVAGSNTAALGFVYILSTLESAADTTLTGVVIDGSASPANTSAGVYLKGAAAKVNMYGCSIKNVGSNGVTTEGAIYSFIAAHNRITDVGRAFDAARSFFAVSAQNGVFCGNITSRTGGNAIQYAVRLYTGIHVISSNYFDGYSTQAVFPAVSVLPGSIDANNYKVST